MLSHCLCSIRVSPGYLPDQLEFSKDCKTLLVSNEAEPISYGNPSLVNDPEGSVSVINLYYCDEEEHHHHHHRGHYGPYSEAQAESLNGTTASADGHHGYYNRKTGCVTRASFYQQKVSMHGLLQCAAQCCHMCPRLHHPSCHPRVQGLPGTCTRNPSMCTYDQQVPAFHVHGTFQAVKASHAPHFHGSNGHDHNTTPHMQHAVV